MTYINKTQPTLISPEEFLKTNYPIEISAGNATIHMEAKKLISFYKNLFAIKCVMWNRIFGFGKYYYDDSKGGQHEYLMTGFAISSSGFTLYNMMGWDNYLKQNINLGKYKLAGKSCLSIKSLSDIDIELLNDIYKQSISDLSKKYKTEIK